MIHAGRSTLDQKKRAEVYVKAQKLLFDDAAYLYKWGLRGVWGISNRVEYQAPADEVETAFLIHPDVLTDFRDYYDFAIETTELIAGLELEGVIQIATFHPRYQFAGTEPDDVENYTNRSPFPMLHLLREESITRVNDDPAKLEEIPRRNVETLRRLGLAKVKQLFSRKPASVVVASTTCSSPSRNSAGTVTAKP